ncbi:hypothetical protein LITTLEE_35 [Mycobacterium phage LittleE]|uniref:Uncharacterized protein n=1 Tax=Mycobacterium phage LittleE TaxID=2922212 RepID=G1D3S0_9CAUD|nr:hypothetical protein FGG27_gp035 [Mycobacterium phage LittleE]AEK09607.1 hypothetical protein LITTLEE_35 [Mycobacterium phage LittleE]
MTVWIRIPRARPGLEPGCMPFALPLQFEDPALPHRAVPCLARPCQAPPRLATSAPGGGLEPPYIQIPDTSTEVDPASPRLAEPCLAEPCLAPPRQHHRSAVRWRAQPTALNFLLNRTPWPQPPPQEVNA